MRFILKPIHLLNRMELRHGGSENRAIELKKILRSQMFDTDIWTEYPSLDHDFHLQYDIKLINPILLRFPRGGIFVFISYFWVGGWLKYANPKHIIIVFNVPNPKPLRELLVRLVELGIKCPISILYAADWMKSLTGIDGSVLLSPIDLDRFGYNNVNRMLIDGKFGFSIGRLSRSVPSKHHPDDVDVYRALSASGINVRLMGADFLRPLFSNDQNIEILDNNSESAQCFLGSLSFFFIEPRLIILNLTEELFMKQWRAGYR